MADSGQITTIEDQSSTESIDSFLTGAVADSWSENDSWSAIAGQTLVGFIPVVGQVADARDIAAAAKRVHDGEDGSWSGLGLATLAIVPGLDFLKAGRKVGGKLVQNIDNVDDVLKAADNAGDTANGAQRIRASTEAYTRAGTARQRLPETNDFKYKTVAADGKQTMSGWRRPPPSGYALATPEEVKAYADKIGHTLTAGGPPDQLSQGGFSGKFHASHAEKQLALRSPHEPIGVTKDMCLDCQAFFTKHAQYTRTPQIVTDPLVTRIFHPDGTSIELLKP